jgi:hypothetical protein
MKPDDFEKRLQSQPLRKIPSEWREQILQGAKPSRHSSFVIRHSFLSTLLWPHPKAWASLAATWVVIAVLQFAASDRPTQLTKKPESPSPETIVLFKQQTRLMAELVGESSSRDMDRPKPTGPQPRSERRSETSFV